YYRLGSKLVATKNASVEYIHTDYLGSPAAFSNSSGVINKTLHSQPFGETIGTQSDDVGYTGHKFDTDIGLSYMQARYYDPVIGRFYSNDAVGFIGHMSRGNPVHGFNRYIYAYNNPYKYIDPDGNISFLVSRPIDNTFVGAVANHNFIVSNARYVGDSKATVHSFGNNGKGIMGKVDGKTLGDSSTTNATDRKAWESLHSGMSDLGDHITQLEGADKVIDAKVDKAANSVVENKKYSYTGINSNSAASAVADKAQGSKVALPDSIKASPGHGNRNEVEFRNQERN
ncbi:RHS repeat-associated core domain-containing protein, partial [Colwellia hornerae]